MNVSEYEFNLSYRIREYRKKNNIKPIDMADHMSMSETNYYKIERGERRIHFSQLMILAEKIKISPSDFSDLLDMPKDSQPIFSILELVAKLILIYREQKLSVNITFDSEQEEFMEKVLLNFKKKASNAC